VTGMQQLTPAACGRVELRKAYIHRQHEHVFAMKRSKEPHLLERSPDDALRFQSVCFSLACALDKVRPDSPRPPPPVERANFLERPTLSRACTDCYRAGWSLESAAAF